MLKLKIIVAAVALGITGIILSNSTHLKSEAKGDFFQEIAGYRTWKQVNRKNEELKIDAFQVFDSSVVG